MAGRVDEVQEVVLASMVVHQRGCLRLQRELMLKFIRNSTLG